MDSSPCKNCIDTINTLDIKRLVFSNSNNSFTSCDPKNISINHSSSGNNYISKINTSQTNISQTKTSQKTRKKNQKNQI